MVRVSLDLAEPLKAAAEDFAARDDVTLGQFVALALAEKVGARGAEAFFAERARGADPERSARWLERAG